MPGFEAGAIVRVPFPYTDRETRQFRPALIISDTPLGPDGTLVWVLMITSAENRGWPGDVSLEHDHAACGLPVPSLIRTAKIATVERSATHLLGVIDPEQLAVVRATIARSVGIGTVQGAR